MYIFADAMHINKMSVLQTHTYFHFIKLERIDLVMNIGVGSSENGNRKEYENEMRVRYFEWCWMALEPDDVMLGFAIQYQPNTPPHRTAHSHGRTRNGNRHRMKRS